MTTPTTGLAKSIISGEWVVLARPKLHLSSLKNVNVITGMPSSTSVSWVHTIRLTCLSLKIFWIDATDSVTIKQSYLRIAQKLLPADQQGPEVAVQKILGLLETTDKWLLVFDNAPDTGLAHYMPDGNRGNIIYTSRQKKLERRILPGCRINVNEMEIGDATTLLLRSARMATDNVETRPIARQLAKELGSLPLALDQAGACKSKVLSAIQDRVWIERDSSPSRPSHQTVDADYKPHRYPHDQLSHCHLLGEV